jgi:hypothetical protein
MWRLLNMYRNKYSEDIIYIKNCVEMISLEIFPLTLLEMAPETASRLYIP